ncbi:MAG TPA: 2-oxoacid:acceptor oxidoreductase subunit alpha [Limnochordales bacterium]|nr:2-oxoacid:acceptor oxidoreductase subunit alpha [Limnochordales bacterium]
MQERRLASWKIGGEQGQGIDSTGEMLATVCNRLGYYIYGYRQFSSRIKGGHSNYKIMIGTEPVASTSSELDVLVAIDQETIDRNHHELVEGGILVADAHFEPVVPEGCPARLLSVPLTRIAQEVGSPVMRNVVSLGVSAYILGLPLEAFKEVVMERFGRKSPEVGEQNVAALEQGYAYAQEHLPELAWRLAPGDGKKRLIMMGNDAVALGAAAAGCRFCAAYPITPASEVMETLMDILPRYGGVVVQAEDEIAAITACIGAGFAGARAITATAGPGISLMQEAIGLAHTAEIPVVIVDTQRGGPSTGMPTKHEQSDLWALLFGTHGDTPRIVLTPSTVEETFYATAEAFNLADKYQCPVFVATDLSLALNKQTVEDLDIRRIKIDRGALLTDEEIAAQAEPDGFRRYRITESGISPRPLPGQPKGQYLATGVEHNEFGKVSEDPKNRVAMMDKRLRKVPADPAALGLEGVTYSGPETPDLLLVGIGSTVGPLSDARKALEAEGYRVGHAQIKVLAPLPVQQLSELFARAKRVLVAENNAQGQLAALIEYRVGKAMREQGQPVPPIHSLRKYDGNPFLPTEIVAEAKEVTSYAQAG